MREVTRRSHFGIWRPRLRSASSYYFVLYPFLMIQSPSQIHSAELMDVEV